MVIELIIELKPIKYFNLLLDQRFNSSYFFINFIIDFNFINLFFIKFDHQDSIFIWSLVIHGNCVKIDSLIENNVFYLPFCFTHNVSKLIKMKEKEFKLDPIILHELYIVHPVCIFFTTDFDHRAESFDFHTVFDQNKSFLHEDLCILFIKN